jgi:hypothetical protein
MHVRMHVAYTVDVSVVNQLGFLLELKGSSPSLILLYLGQ